MKRWQAILVGMAIVGLVLVVAWVDDPEDYAAPTTAAYFTGIVYARSADAPNVWHIMDLGCNSDSFGCKSFPVEDAHLTYNQVVTLAIGSEPHYHKVEGGGYAPDHITVVNYNANNTEGH